MERESPYSKRQRMDQTEQVPLHILLEYMSVGTPWTHLRRTCPWSCHWHSRTIGSLCLHCWSGGRRIRRRYIPTRNITSKSGTRLRALYTSGQMGREVTTRFKRRNVHDVIPVGSFGQAQDLCQAITRRFEDARAGYGFTAISMHFENCRQPHLHVVHDCAWSNGTCRCVAFYGIVHGPNHSSVWTCRTTGCRTTVSKPKITKITPSRCCLCRLRY